MVHKILSKPIKILIVVKSVDGGTGSFVLSLLKMTKLFGKKLIIKVFVLERPAYRSPTKFQASFFTNKKAYPNYYSFAPGNITKFYQEFKWLRKKITQFKPQIVLSVDVHCNLLAILSKKLLFDRIKVVATTHIDLLETLSEKSSPLTKYLLKICIRFLYPKADILIGVSKGVTRDLQQNFGLAKSVITVNNGVFINKINQKKIVTKLPEKILITASRLEQQKDNENLIKAFYFLQKNIPNVKLWILGEGSRRSKLEEFVKKLNLENNVTFFGWVNNIDKYLTQADLFILSSKREGLPYVLLEAMKYGLPIISTNSPFGPSEVLDGGKYGLLVPVGNASALNKSMYNLLINRHLYNYYSKRSIERVRFFSEKKMLREYEKIFAKLVLE